MSRRYNLFMITLYAIVVFPIIAIGISKKYILGKNIGIFPIAVAAVAICGFIYYLISFNKDLEKAEKYDLLKDFPEKGGDSKS